jgi:hypothetical protein
MNNPYLSLFQRIKENIDRCFLREGDKSLVKAAILESFADELQSQGNQIKAAKLLLMDLLDHTVPSLDMANEKAKSNPDKPATDGN